MGRKVNLSSGNTAKFRRFQQIKKNLSRRCRLLAATRVLLLPAQAPLPTKVLLPPIQAPLPLRVKQKQKQRQDRRPWKLLVTSVIRISLSSSGCSIFTAVQRSSVVQSFGTVLGALILEYCCFKGSLAAVALMELFMFSGVIFSLLRCYKYTWYGKAFQFNSLHLGPRRFHQNPTAFFFPSMSKFSFVYIFFFSDLVTAILDCPGSFGTLQHFLDLYSSSIFCSHGACR